MAHFAQLVPSGTPGIWTVDHVEAIHDNEVPDEATGLAFLEKLYGPGIKWKQTSYNTRANVHIRGGVPFRKNYAGIGYTYDEARDAYISPKPFPSWVLNEETGQYDPPISHPKDGKNYGWNEDKRVWEEMVKV